MEFIKEYSSISLMGIELYQYLAAFLSILAGFVLKRASTMVANRLLAVATKTRFRIDEVMITALGPPVGWAFMIGGIYLATVVLPLPREPVDIRFFVNSLVRAASVILVIWFATRLIDQLSAWWMEKALHTQTKLDEQFIPIVRSSTKVFFVMIGLVLFLQNLGYSVTSLVAGLGIGGAALAFASKDTLSNLFGSVVIFLDRPFHIGDWIEMGGVEGTVEEVGLRTTRIRTFANSLITMPNAMLTTTAINNWSRMKKRRIKTSIGITYDTPPEKVEAAVNKIRELIKTDPALLDDFFLVHFDQFGDSSLDIFIYCFTKTTNWAEFMDAKQAFYLNIMRAFNDIGIEFAFPTRSIHIESMPGEPEAMTGQRPQ